MLEIAVITVSDRAFSGEYEDLSGPKIKEIIDISDVDADVSITIVPDEKEKIEMCIKNNLGKDFIFTTGTPPYRLFASSTQFGGILELIATTVSSPIVTPGGRTQSAPIVTFFPMVTLFL